MSSVRPKIHTVLTADATVAGLVVARVYSDVLPQECTYPAIVHSRGGGTTVSSLSGYSGLEFPTISIDAWAQTSKAADMLAEAIRTAMFAATTFRTRGCTAPQDFFEPDTRLYRVAVDYFVTNENG